MDEEFGGLSRGQQPVAIIIAGRVFGRRRRGLGEQPGRQRGYQSGNLLARDGGGIEVKHRLLRP
jgi:hypothetical protein